MKWLIIVVIAGLNFIRCSGESLQEALSGCEIEEGTAACFDLENRCLHGFSKWNDPDALNQVKCQCCGEEE